MEEKMNGLETLVNGVDKYCTENSIEYLFAAVVEKEGFLIKHNTITNAILNEATKIVKTLIKK